MRRWQWKEFRAETFTHFYDLEREGAWSDLGPTGTLRVKEAWVGGAPVGSTFFYDARHNGVRESLVACRATAGGDLLQDDHARHLGGGS